MAGNRRVFEKIIIDAISRLSNHPQNTEFYEKKFREMSDEQLDQFVKDLDEGKIRLSVVEPNWSGVKPVEDAEIIKICREHGYEPYQRLYTEGKPGLPTYLTQAKFLVILVNARRASQLLTKKISVPPHTKVRDLLTGQVTGESKGATVSAQEVQVLAGMGAEYSAVEMLKYRGGDQQGEAAFMAMLSKYGRANQSVLEQFSSGVQATRAVNTYLTAAMHRINL